MHAADKVRAAAEVRVADKTPAAAAAERFVEAMDVVEEMDAAEAIAARAIGNQHSRDSRARLANTQNFVYTPPKGFNT